MLRGLMSFAQGNPYDILIPNFFIGDWECDLFKLTKSGIFVEYEIKTSVADFKKDFEKGNKEYVVESQSSVKVNLKHDIIKSGERCNRFFFVCPSEIVHKIDVPDYCGLISYLSTSSDYGYFNLIKSARLMGEKRHDTLPMYREIATSLAFREQIWRRKVFILEQSKKYDAQRGKI